MICQICGDPTDGVSHHHRVAPPEEVKAIRMAAIRSCLNDAQYSLRTALELLNAVVDVDVPEPPKAAKGD